MVFLRHYDLQDRALYLDTDGEYVELSVSDISSLTVHSPLPQQSHKMHGEKGKLELFLRDGRRLEFDLFLTVAQALCRRLRDMLLAVCNITPRWLMV